MYRSDAGQREDGHTRTQARMRAHRGLKRPATTEDSSCCSARMSEPIEAVRASKAFRMVDRPA